MKRSIERKKKEVNKKMMNVRIYKSELIKAIEAARAELDNSPEIGGWWDYPDFITTDNESSIATFIAYKAAHGINIIVIED